MSRSEFSLYQKTIVHAVVLLLVYTLFRCACKLVSDFTQFAEHSTRLASE